MYLGATERQLPTPGNALRFLDRNATILKAGLSFKEKDYFDDCVTALWELFLKGREKGTHGTQSV